VLLLRLLREVVRDGVLVHLLVHLHLHLRRHAFRRRRKVLLRHRRRRARRAHLLASAPRPSECAARVARAAPCRRTRGGDFRSFFPSAQMQRGYCTRARS
jgi:hypothetical protein